MNPRRFSLVLALLLMPAIPVMAGSSENGEIFPSYTWTLPGTLPTDGLPSVSRSARTWQVTFAEPSPVTGPGLLASAAAVAPEPAADLEQRPVAFTYSEAYNMRRKIHMIASYVTLPLFVTQVVAGQKLYDQGGGTARSVHDAGMAGIIALFAVNTVTGGWNFWEGRKDPNGKTRRLVHTLMMFGADLGFVATGALAPDDDSDEGGGSSGNRSLHRNVAITSMGVAAASYVYMLVTR
jgi:hypothetical protein